MKVTVIIPAYNSERTLPHLIESLKQLSTQAEEIIIVDDHSTDNTFDIAKKSGFIAVKTAKNGGPAKARNFGIKMAHGDVIAFTDADCVVKKDWIQKIKRQFTEENTSILMGNVKIPASTYLGDSISALGFPGGGAIGFDKIWRVHKNGLTDHITSCNFAAKKSVFLEHGDFDESFPLPGCEDSELSYRYTSFGIPIKYDRQMIVYHEARDCLWSFVRWQIVRGRGNYYFKKKIGSVKSFIKLRLWSSMNILKHYLLDKKLPLIVFLLSLSFTLQQWGFYIERNRNKA